jgi:hypothetical protein
MKPIRETLRSLENQESGEIRRSRCSACGQKLYEPRQIELHQLVCPRVELDQRTVELKKS